jgi:hypothetical protein
MPAREMVLLAAGFGVQGSAFWVLKIGVRV